jgi:Family of unknown function (DUF5670)
LFSIKIVRKYFGSIFPLSTILSSLIKHSTMGNLLYLIAVILIIAWAIGFLGYHASGLIHILLVIAVIAILLRIIRGGTV